MKRFEAAKEFDAHRAFLQEVPDMVRRAREARDEEAFSYRDFKVGAAIFAWAVGTSETAVMVGANTKAKQHKEKVCAEPKLLQRAKNAGYSDAIGLVVVATGDVDLIKGVLGYQAPTLHPCTTCQADFRSHRLVSDDTIIVSVNAERDVFQAHSFRELSQMYAEKAVEAEQRVYQEGFGRSWSRRLATYDALVSAEAVMPGESHRERAVLALAALAVEV